MDVNTILGALPSLGPTGLLLLILAYVSRQWILSDTRYRAEINRLNAAHAAELDRVTNSHDAELDELRTEIRALRSDIEELRGDLERERQLRFTAQEEAHRARLTFEGS